jgi:hypothetical protein
MLDYKNSLNGTRLVLLSRIAFLDEWRPYFLTGAIMGALVLLYGIQSQSFGHGFFIGLSLFIGVVLVSRIFNDLYNPEQGTYYLTLPASIAEKYLVKLLSTTVVFFAYIVLAVFLGNTLANLINRLFYGTPLTLYNPFAGDLFGTFKTYIFFHAIFFFGSLSIKKNSFLKTVLVCLAISFILSFVMLFLAKTLMTSNLQLLKELFIVNNDELNISSPFMRKMLIFLKFIFSYFLPLALYAAAYFKLRKIEIKG